MAKYVVDSTTLTDIADSIREKKGTADAIKPENMPEEIASIETAGVETCTVVILDDINQSPIVLTYMALENGKLVTKQVEDPFVWNDEYDNEAAVLENVVVGTSVTFEGGANYLFSGENFEPWFVAEGMAMDYGFPIYNLKILGDATITAEWE